MILPLPKEYWSKVTQGFGVPSKRYVSGVHNGVDFGVPIGTPVYAPCDGEITSRFVNHVTMGKCIYFLGEGHGMRFMHLSVAMAKGTYKQGDLIGKTGNSGLSTGPHLHLDIWVSTINTALIRTASGVHKYMIDPLLFFKEVI